MAINKTQIVTGIIILFTGALVYVADRPAESTLFMSIFLSKFSFYNKIPSVFGIYGNCLPAFTHVLSFSLLTAGFAEAKKTDYKAICFFWFFVNFICELGQKYSSFASKLIPAKNIQGFFINGTFDYLDILAFIAGGVIAYTFLIFTGNKELTI